MRICKAPTKPAEFSRQMSQILDNHGITKFVLIGHSYGTVLSTHLLHCPFLGPRIDSLVLIDPITFLLHLPSVAYNFTCRRPVTANQVQLDYFASKDPGIAHTICRHFFWTQNIMWKEELRGKRCAIALSGQDLLVDSTEVWEYLTGKEMRDADEEVVVFRKERAGEGEEELTVMWYGRCDHAQIFETERRRNRLVRIVGEFTSGRREAMLRA
jgi:pimeloyl-ACP methyl ester carboxylesterase